MCDAWGAQRGAGSEGSCAPALPLGGSSMGSLGSAAEEGAPPARSAQGCNGAQPLEAAVPQERPRTPRSPLALELWSLCQALRAGCGGGWEPLRGKWKCCSVGPGKARQGCDGTRGGSGGSGRGDGGADPERGHRVPACNRRPGAALPCPSCASCARLTCGLHRRRELREAPAGRPEWPVSGEARFQADSPPPGWQGRQGAGSLAGSAFYCCCAAVPAEPSTAEYRWCLFNLAPPPHLSFNCSVPVPSNKLCALLKHCTSYRYCQRSSKFMARMCLVARRVSLYKEGRLWECLTTYILLCHVSI